MTTFDRFSSEQIRAHRETVLLRLLLRVQQLETAELVRRLAANGHADVRTSYIGLLGNVDTEGTRLVTLAQRTGNTRQAASQMVAEIESRGYLERTPDPDDKRAVLVRHTAAGRALLNDALEAMADIEAGYATLVGEKKLAAVKQVLATIADQVGPGSKLGEL